MRLFGLMLALWATPSFAQAPGGMPALPPGLTFPGLGAPPVPANAKYVQADTPSTRFADADLAGPIFTKGAPVVVLVEEAARVRVVQGDQYGWIPKAALGDMPPAVDPVVSPAVPVTP